MKKEYIIEYRFQGGTASSFCKNIFVVPEVLDEILERDDVIMDSIIISTTEVPGDIFDDVRDRIKKIKEKKSN